MDAARGARTHGGDRLGVGAEPPLGDAPRGDAAREDGAAAAAAAAAITRPRRPRSGIR